MAYSNKVRISIAVTEELNERIGKMADRFGMSKATLCAMLVNQSIDSFEKAMNMISNPQFMGQVLSMIAPNSNQDVVNKLCDDINEYVNNK